MSLLRKRTFRIEHHLNLYALCVYSISFFFKYNSTIGTWNPGKKVVDP